jgi:hypothetical protein
MKRSSNPPDPSRPAPVAPAYPSLLDLALWSGRRAVVAGGAVVALAGGITGCDATAARDIAQLAGSDYGQSPDVPMDAPWTYPEIGGADVGVLPDVPMGPGDLAGRDVGEAPDVPLDAPFTYPDLGGIGGTDMGSLPDVPLDEAAVPDLPADLDEPADTLPDGPAPGSH